MKKYNVAVVGATGLVGQTFLKVLKERNFFAKIFSAKKIPDIYFHSGSLDDECKNRKEKINLLEFNL